MRILIYGINYAPELTGIGKYSGELGAWMVNNKHQVEVITANPYYPEWKIHSSYNNKFWYSEYLQGVRVFRAPLYVPKKVTSFKRILHEVSFILGSMPYWLRAIFQKRHDIILCVAPAFHLGLVALLYAKLRRVPLIYHIQDLQVDAARDLGMISDRRVLAILFKAERFILKSSSLISTISEGMLQKIQVKGIDEKKCVLFPNWVDIKHIRPLSKKESLREEFGLKETDKVILYSGNLGEKQGLELIIETAKAFLNYNDLYFLIIGSGGAKKNLIERVTKNRLKNVKIFPLQPYEKLSAMLATADLHLVLQRKAASDLVMPSKLTSILAAGGCSIVTALSSTSLYKIVKENRLGITIEPESVDALRQGIETALNSDLDSYKKNARQYAERYLCKEIILKKFENEMNFLKNKVY